MGVKVATGCLKWSQSSPSSPQTLASAISSPSTKRRSLTDVALFLRPAMFGSKLNRSRSCEIMRISGKRRSIKRAVSATFDAEFSDEEISPEIQELALRFQLSDEDDNDNTDKPEPESKNPNLFDSSKVESPEWQGDMIPASIERKANSFELPFSLRIIKKKKQWQEGFKEAGESAYCSMKKAFSSMVFIIRELQSYSLQLREILFYEDLQEILVRVQKEMNASFVWLFQQVFSQTPTLMVYVMILLANYSVHSMSNNLAFAAAAPPPAAVESVSSIEEQSSTKFDSSSVKTFSVNSGGRTTAVGGINGGGGKFRPVANSSDGDGNGFYGASSLSMVDPTRSGREESVSGREEERVLWNWMVDEADKMRDGGIDHETMGRFVAPIMAEVKEDEDEDQMRTELVYQTGLSQEPDNPLLLANYAQFLYLIVHDYDRAENYFKRASMAEPKDAEALSKYAIFLWKAKNDTWAAEETYLEAISVDPDNSYYSANYASFLWGTGSDDACFPIDSSENMISDDL